MNSQDDAVITVHGTWDGWQHAEVRLNDLRDVHWLQPDRAPHRIIHGVVLCGQLLNGAIPHRCDAQSAPHELRVCVLKRHAVSTAYAELTRRADALEGRPQAARRDRDIAGSGSDGVPARPTRASGVTTTAAP